jgi:hypothetical protein
VKALWIASAVVLVLAQACGGAQKPNHGADQRAEIIALWTQIRDFRRQAKMELDPSPMTLNQIRFKSVKDAEKVCVENHKVPKTCDDVCGLADAICDNSDAICKLADELGKEDDFAQGKCTDAKASCREAKQKCCGCSATEASP